MRCIIIVLIIDLNWERKHVIIFGFKFKNKFDQKIISVQFTFKRKMIVPEECTYKNVQSGCKLQSP